MRKVLKDKNVKTFIRRSCITGDIVWFYRGLTKNAERIAYCRACKKEISYIEEGWEKEQAERRADIKRYMNDLLARIPITAELTPEQKEGIHLLQEMANHVVKPYRAFYDHIMEERRRRAEDREIRRQMRERELAEKQQNANYDK